jgi:ABC-type bacteriocin/lantibiotic exporter with double-glycine peptidase domain
MHCVIQEEQTGCGIAAVANILGKSYSEMKTIANSMGIFAEDSSLWSDTQPIKKMLNHFGINTSENEIPFTTWSELPDCALLSIKYHIENGNPFWHWVVFYRLNGQESVLDSASYLETNIRTDFNSMHPKWYINVHI